MSFELRIQENPRPADATLSVNSATTRYVSPPIPIYPLQSPRFNTGRGRYYGNRILYYRVLLRFITGYYGCYVLLLRILQSFFLNGFYDSGDSFEKSPKIAFFGEIGKRLT